MMRMQTVDRDDVTIMLDGDPRGWESFFDLAFALPEGDPIDPDPGVAVLPIAA